MEGDPGTGKTTTARYFAEKTNRPCAIATMPFRPAPLDLLRLVHHAVHASRPPSRINRYDLTQDLVEHLRVWQGVLVVDELQNTGANAMQDLVYLYEEAEHAFALVLVGSTVLTAVNAHPQLATRIMGSTTFLPLAGDELLQTVRDMDPRLARTPAAVLLEHDARACKGVLRRWVKTIDWLDEAKIHDSEAVPNAVLHAIARKFPAWN